MNKTYIANGNHPELKAGTEVYLYDEMWVTPYNMDTGLSNPERQPDWYDEVEWKPEEGEEYYYVEDCEFNKDLVVQLTEFEDTGWDEYKYRVGNCYKTREEAEQARKRVLKAYKGE